MPERRMLRDIMTVSDVYQYADSIMELLREIYGSYDAEVLDEVLIDESFAQRLAARGYEVRTWGDGTAGEEPAPSSAPVPVPSAGDVVPVTIVRPRRTTASGDRPTSSTTRTRRTPGAEGSRPAPTGEGLRPRAESSRASAGESGRAGSDAAQRPSAPPPSAPSAPSDGSRPAPTRRRTTRTPRSNGDSES